MAEVRFLRRQGLRARLGVTIVNSFTCQGEGRPLRKCTRQSGAIQFQLRIKLVSEELVYTGEAIVVSGEMLVRRGEEGRAAHRSGAGTAG